MIEDAQIPNLLSLKVPFTLAADFFQKDKTETNPVHLFQCHTIETFSKVFGDKHC